MKLQDGIRYRITTTGIEGVYSDSKKCLVCGNFFILAGNIDLSKLERVA